MPMSEQQMREEACLFGKSGKSLTKYQQQLNNLPGELCLKDPLLLQNKGKLLQLAREKLHESGYVYAKGKSRSKVFHPSTEKQTSRRKIDKEEREHRIQSITEQLGDIKKHISVKEKRIEQAQSVQNKLCDQLSDEITSLKAKRRELESALRGLQLKKKKSDQYFARKAGGECSATMSSAASNESSSFL